MAWISWANESLTDTAPLVKRVFNNINDDFYDSSNYADYE